MDVKIGGGTLALILMGLAIAFGINECQRGPLDPPRPENISNEDNAWLTLQHRIKRADPALTEISRESQKLTILYQPQPVAGDDEAWVPRLLRTLGQGLAAVNSAPGGKSYHQVTIKARIIADDDVELVYDMDGFDAIKHWPRPAITAANRVAQVSIRSSANVSAPRSLSSAEGLNECITNARIPGSHRTAQCQ